MTKSLGEWIRGLRDNMDISLREFAKKIDVTPAHLSDIELGRRYPSPELLKRLAMALRVSLEDLEKHDSRPPVDAIKRLSEANPAYGFAFRQLMDQVRDHDLSAEDLLKAIDKSKVDRKQKK